VRANAGRKRSLGQAQSPCDTAVPRLPPLAARARPPRRVGEADEPGAYEATSRHRRDESMLPRLLSGGPLTRRRKKSMAWCEMSEVRGRAARPHEEERGSENRSRVAAVGHWNYARAPDLKVGFSRAAHTLMQLTRAVEESK